MTPEQLDREREFGRYAAIAAFAAAVFTIASVSYQAALKSVHAYGHTLKPLASLTAAQSLIVVAHQPTTFLVISILNALAIPFVALALYHLFRATRARRPEVPGVFRWLILIAPMIAATLGIVNQAILNHAAKQFVHTRNIHQILGKAGDKHATHLAQQGGAVLGTISGIAELAFVFAFAMTCVYAMRVGLLNRAMGYVGALVAILYFLPILAFLSPQLPSVVQTGWYVALGLLFLRRLPGVPDGTFPAWERGEAVPWPTAAERRAAAEGGDGAAPPKQPRPAARASGGELARRVRAASREDGHDAAGATTAVSDGEAETPRPHPRSKKRKRKRR